MDWETINGITGIVSAVCSVLGLGYFGKKRKSQLNENKYILTLPMLMSFILISSGWALLCLCVLWVFKPFGTYMLNEHYLQFYGVVLALPALIVLNFGIISLQSQSAKLD